MSFIKNIFGKKDEPIRNYTEFWNWFSKNEKEFYNVVKNEKDIVKDFFDKLSPKLDELKDGYYFLAGMFNENTVELVITADGNTQNIVFVEELISQAPKIPGWKFTALKPALNIEDVSIDMGGYKFNSDNMYFYYEELSGYPDEIDIKIIHDSLNNDNRSEITNGVYIFLDNYLGELDFVNNIDNLQIISHAEAQKELIPINKMKDFLIWRQKEFIEKYEGTRYDTEKDEHSLLEAQLKGGGKLFATINTQILKWDRKASHPWVSILTIKYDGHDRNGMPNETDFELLNIIENEILDSMVDKEGYLNIGRQTANNEREIYFACKDFRKPSKIFYQIQKKYSDKFEIESDIFKDKYWRTFERFNPN